MKDPVDSGPDTSIGRLEVSHIQKAYGKRQVVKDVSLTVRTGEVVGLLGPNDGYTHPGREIELVTLRLRAVLKSHPLLGAKGYVGTAALGQSGRAKLGRLSSPEAQVHFDSKKQKSKIYERENLVPKRTYTGPAIITEYSATTVVPPGKRFRLDKAANLVISLAKSL